MFDRMKPANSRTPRQCHMSWIFAVILRGILNTQWSLEKPTKEKVLLPMRVNLSGFSVECTFS